MLLPKPGGFLFRFFWTGTDWEYETKDSLPGDITLTNEEGNEYTVSREEPTHHLTPSTKLPGNAMNLRPKRRQLSVIRHLV